MGIIYKNDKEAVLIIKGLLTKEQFKRFLKVRDTPTYSEPVPFIDRSIGHVYLATTPSHPGTVKIGVTRDKKLVPYEIVWSIELRDPPRVVADAKMALRDFKVGDSLFACVLQHAIDTVEEVAYVSPKT